MLILKWVSEERGKTISAGFRWLIENQLISATQQFSLTRKENQMGTSDLQISITLV